MYSVKEALWPEYKFESVKYWTDSKTVLCWIVNSECCKQFVEHRVDEILRIRSKSEWYHCPGKENPADLGSRRVFATELKNSSIWWSGPSWLKGDPKDYLKLKEVVFTLDGKVEEEKAFSVSLINVETLFSIGNVISINRTVLSHDC